MSSLESDLDVSEEDQSYSPVAASQSDSIAVGLIVTDATTDQIARSILRAVAHEYSIFIISPTTIGSEIERFVKQVDGKVINSYELENPLALEHTVAAVADSHGFSHIIVHTDLTERINYERTDEVIEATDQRGIEPVLQAEPSASPSLIAAIPAYNESRTIEDVVTEASQYVDEVIVVDDASQDDTAVLASEAGAEVIQHEQNKGYGGALSTIFEEADDRNSSHLVILDGDGQHDPSDIPEAVQVQQECGAEIVIGSRFTDDAETDLPLYRWIGLFIINTLTNLSIGVVRREPWIRDTQCGFRTYNQQAINSLSNEGSIGSNMSASTDILYHAHQQGYDFEEIGTTVDYDVENPSSHSPVSHGFTLVSNILQTIERERPVLSLGGPGFVSAFVGLGFGYWTFSNYISSGSFPIGLAVTSVFFVLAGIFSCFTAIILHSLNQHLDI